MDRATEDFAEMVAIYVTNDASTWEDMLASAGTTGRPIIEKKFEIVFDYMLNSWGLDLDKLREIVLRRQSEITELDLSNLFCFSCTLQHKNRPGFLLWKPGRFVCFICAFSSAHAITCGGS